MKLYFKALAIFIGVLGHMPTNAQLKLPQKQVTSYFSERITLAHVEDKLVSFDGKNVLSKKNVEPAKTDVWKLWKAVNQKIEQLPTTVEGSLDMAPHEWILVGEDPMPFYYFRKGQPAAAGVPLFLNLHGSGPKAMEFKNTTAWALRYMDGPSLYFIPQIPNERRYRWWLKPVQYAWERLFRMAMLDSNIDPNKIYITGISEGGYGSQRLGAYYADYLAGVGPMAGGEPLRNAPPVNYRYVAFSLQTGENDHMFGRNKLTQAAKDTFDVLSAEHPADYKHQVIIQPNKGHGIDYTTTTPWLINYTRNPAPKELEWVLFPMDGRYRKAFYNIALNSTMKLKEGDVQDRVIFKIKYDNNRIYIDTYSANAELTERDTYEELDFSIFLDDRYINYANKVKVIYNGRHVFNRKVKLEESALIESCAVFGDPERVFPVRINIKN